VTSDYERMKIIKRYLEVGLKQWKEKTNAYNFFITMETAISVD
jgi:hypothetical protein